MDPQPGEGQSPTSVAKRAIAAFSDSAPYDDEKLFVISYKSLRRCVGVVGLALPVVLFFSQWWPGDPFPMPGSISAYYYTHLGPYFVGSLCALGVFLFSYRYAPKDNYLSYIASILIVFVALCPTADQCDAGGTCQRNAWNNLHLIAAFAFFGIVAFFSAFIFTRKGGEKHYWEAWAGWTWSTPKEQRRCLYRICGVLTLAAPIAAILANKLADQHLLFWGEALGVVAFSFAWLVKGDFRWFWGWVVLPDSER